MISSSYIQFVAYFHEFIIQTFNKSSNKIHLIQGEFYGPYYTMGLSLNILSFVGWFIKFLNYIFILKQIKNNLSIYKFPFEMLPKYKSSKSLIFQFITIFIQCVHHPETIILIKFCLITVSRQICKTCKKNFLSALLKQ